MSQTTRSHAVRELPAVVRFRQYARFERIDRAENCERFYALRWQPLLWGGGALVRTWGRIGTQGQQRLDGPAPRRAPRAPAPHPPVPTGRLVLNRLF